MDGYSPKYGKNRLRSPRLKHIEHMEYVSWLHLCPKFATVAFPHKSCNTTGGVQEGVTPISIL